MTSLTELRATIHQALGPDLLSDDYRHTWSEGNPTAGLCSVATEAAWFVLGGSQQGWLPKVTRDPEGGTHWWLEHADGTRFDPTEEQYRSVGRLPPYERGAPGRGGAFMGVRVDPGNRWGFDRKPSKRAGALLDRMGIEPESRVGPDSHPEKISSAKQATRSAAAINYPKNVS